MGRILGENQRVLCKPLPGCLLPTAWRSLRAGLGPSKVTRLANYFAQITVRFSGPRVSQSKVWRKDGRRLTNLSTCSFLLFGLPTLIWKLMGATYRIVRSCISGLGLPGMLGLLHCSVHPGPACQGLLCVGGSICCIGPGAASKDPSWRSTFFFAKQVEAIWVSWFQELALRLWCMLLRLSYLFAHLHLLSSETFSSLIFSLLLFSSLWLFPSLLFICPYCRKFDS